MDASAAMTSTHKDCCADSLYRWVIADCSPMRGIRCSSWSLVVAMVLLVTDGAAQTPTTPSAILMDLADICSKQHAAKLEVNSVIPMYLRLNASSAVTEDREIFSCFFTLRLPRWGINITLDISWTNLGGDCPDYIQVMQTQEKTVVYLDGTGHHSLSVGGVSQVDMHVSVCQSKALGRNVLIKVTAPQPETDGKTDVTSIVLAFIAPFAFILLTVVMAFMGNCCCARRCGNVAPAAANTAPAAANADPVRNPLADKPPSYDELFPNGCPLAGKRSAEQPSTSSDGSESTATTITNETESVRTSSGETVNQNPTASEENIAIVQLPDVVTEVSVSEENTIGPIHVVTTSVWI